MRIPALSISISTITTLLKSAKYDFFVVALYPLSVNISFTNKFSGMFVPSFLMGAILGRITGQVVQYIFPDATINTDLGNFALIGAASVLSGVTRMTISITVIILESTNDIRYGLPIVLTIMVCSAWRNRTVALKF